MISSYTLFLLTSVFCLVAAYSRRIADLSSSSYRNMEQQSPIDIKKNQLIKRRYSRLNWRHYKTKPTNITIENNGHTVDLTAMYSSSKRPCISNGPLNSTYCLEKIHFHWGSTNSKGSEHTIDGYRFPLEMHAVHCNQKYGTFENAVDKSDGLAVVAFVGQITSSKLLSNKGIRYITSEFQGLSSGTKKSMKYTFRLKKLLIPFDWNYVTYRGSLTTPEYQETVTWLISPYPLLITKHQLKKFRTLEGTKRGTKIEDNFRPTQSLNGRKIYIIDYKGAKNMRM